MIGLPMPKLPMPLHKFDRIAFAGPMCVGKTTLAVSLLNTFDGLYTKISFADKLKALAYSLYGVQGKDNQSRKLLQELADDLKKWDSELIIKHLLLEAQKSIEHGYTKIVIDDVRFKAEEVALHLNGFVVISITCDEAVRQDRIRRLYPDIDPARFAHPSEYGWQGMEMDYKIDSTTEIARYDVLRLIEDGYKDSTRR